MMEISNLSDAEFKTLVIRMPMGLSEDLSSIKQIKSETKDTQTEIKSNLQGNNSKGYENEKSMIWNIKKRKTTNQNKKKKELKKK